MWRIVQRCVNAALAGAGALVIFMAEVSPQGAHSNIAAWFSWVGAHHVPRWLLGNGVDRTVLIVGVVLLVLNMVMFIASFREPRRRDARVPKASSYMTPYEVIHYLADQSAWGWVTARHVEPSIIGPIWKNPHIEAPSEFCAKAMLEGTRIKAFGRLDGTAETRPIPHTFWMSNGFAYQTWFDRNQRSRTAPTVYAASAPIYFDVLIDRLSVLKTWPRMNFIRRIMVQWRRRCEDSAPPRLGGSWCGKAAPNVLGLRSARSAG